MLVIFASNVKCSDTRNSLPNFCMLVIFTFSLKTRITQNFPARKLLTFYSILSITIMEAKEDAEESILKWKNLVRFKMVNQTWMMRHGQSV